MKPLSALHRAPRLLEERLAEIETRLRSGDESAWGAYGETLRTLAAVLQATAPGAGGEMLTTRQLAARLQLTPKTVRRKAKAGQIAPPLRLGGRGRGALRWSA